jgi:hypothetical protein
MFYIFASVSQFVSKAIAPDQFALILAFGFVISLAEFMYEELKLKKVLKCIIHYCVLLVAFCLIFIVSGNISNQRPSAVFGAIVVYTILYFTVFAVIHFARLMISKADDKLDEKQLSKKNKHTKNEKGAYKSLYSDGN